jgi:hypothetical protein
VAVRDFSSTSDGEWTVANGDFSTVADADAVPQGIRIRVGMFLGECYLDESVGVDYVDSILVKGADPLVVRALLSTAIADTPDVTNVVGAQLVDDGDRQSSIVYQVDTTYSDEPISGQIGVG